ELARKRRTQIAWAAAIVMAVLTVIAVWQWGEAIRANRVANAKTEEAEKQTLIARANENSERMAKNFIARVADTLQGLSTFVPEETEALLRQSTEAIVTGRVLDADNLMFLQIDALEEMARYFYDAWNYGLAEQFLQDADDRLRQVSAAGRSLPEFTRLKAGRLEIGGDLHANNNGNFGNPDAGDRDVQFNEYAKAIAQYGE